MKKLSTGYYEQSYGLNVRMAKLILGLTNGTNNLIWRTAAIPLYKIRKPSQRVMTGGSYYLYLLGYNTTFAQLKEFVFRHGGESEDSKGRAAMTFYDGHVESKTFNQVSADYGVLRALEKNKYPKTLVFHLSSSLRKVLHMPDIRHFSRLE